MDENAQLPIRNGEAKGNQWNNKPTISSKERTIAQSGRTTRLIINTQKQINSYYGLATTPYTKQTKKLTDLLLENNFFSNCLEFLSPSRNKVVEPLMRCTGLHVAVFHLDK